MGKFWATNWLTISTSSAGRKIRRYYPGNKISPPFTISVVPESTGHHREKLGLAHLEIWCTFQRTVPNKWRDPSWSAPSSRLSTKRTLHLHQDFCHPPNMLPITGVASIKQSIWRKISVDIGRKTPIGTRTPKKLWYPFCFSDMGQHEHNFLTKNK
ncbi:unnamed protein product [Nesidiocoris tenuis]|uniref:Uncharacterized protein n=1 Tax=Nesidiocoris tenuis TaxID=355587 RepID=A0A6H5GX44_9HEMI|nr:unnamed protein product [Nesidiocoris tenuis]